MMYDKWLQLSLLFLPLEEAQRCWLLLTEAYGQEHRRYHNLQHIQQLLQLAEQYRHKLQDYFTCSLAIWTHDWVYDPARRDNEAASAQLAEEVFQDYLPQPKMDLLKKFILATATHSLPAEASSDLAYFLDFDLAILGQEPKAYAQYVQAIEAEYTTVYPLEQYRMGRQVVLERFLARPQLYFSLEFKQELEVSARQNLLAELQALQGMNK